MTHAIFSFRKFNLLYVFAMSNKRKNNNNIFVSLGNILGLLGNYNGNASDDFVARNGTVLKPPLPMRDIHFDFGMSCKYAFKHLKVHQNCSH